MNERDIPEDGSAHMVESVLIPLLFALFSGCLLARAYYEPRLQAADQAASQALRAVRLTQARLQLYAQACDPLLSWPVEATPELLDVGHVGQAGPVGQRP